MTASTTPDLDRTGPGLAGLARFIDHAPLFPPAQLPPSEAVDSHVRALGSANREAVNTLAWPVDRHGELVALLNPRPPERPEGGSVDSLGRSPMAIAALVGPDAVMELAVESTRGRGSIWFDDDSPVAAVQIETALPDQDQDRVGRLLDGLTHLDRRSYVEIPVAGQGAAAVDRLVTAAAADLRSLGPTPIGLKVRCGGEGPTAVPSAAELAAFVVAATANGVTWKATAGLHHAWCDLRAVHPRHGLANLLLAAALAVDGRSVDGVAERLTAPDPEPVTSERLARARQVFRSLGSCSFDEPIDELAPWLSPSLSASPVVVGAAAGSDTDREARRGDRP